MCHFDHDKLPSWDDAPVHIPVDNVPVYSHHCEHWVVMVLNTLPVWTSQILSIMIMQSYEHLGKNEAMFFLLYLLLHFGHIFLLQLLRTKAETFERCWPWGNSVSFLFVLSLEVNPNYSSGWATENFCSIWNILCSRKFSHSFVMNLKAWLQQLQLVPKRLESEPWRWGINSRHFQVWI